MKLALLFLSIIILIHTPVKCQRRAPCRGRQPPRRLPPCIEDRLRGILPSYRAPEIPAVNRITELPIVPCNRVEPPSLTAIGQVAPPSLTALGQVAPPSLTALGQVAPPSLTPIPQSIKPDLRRIPATDYYQNVLQSNQLLPEVLRHYQASIQVPMQNVQYFQNLVIPQDRLEVPVLEVPRIPEKIIQPYSVVEAEKQCSCRSPTPQSLILPAASPLSPWMTPRLPQASNQARSHLRKIPIPPPTL